MIRQLCEISNFALRLRVQMRFGRLSRAPLRLLRLELCGDSADCDWIARPLDRWDEDLPRHLGEHQAAVQALEDALAIRELLFYTLPDLSSASLKVYRKPVDQPPELIIAGTVTRPEPVHWIIHSLVMRAKLGGFEFLLNDGRLEPLPNG